MSKYQTHKVKVGVLTIGSDLPVIIQSMTNTQTNDIASTVSQIIELAKAGSEMVRITINNDSAAKSVASIITRVRDLGYDLPIIGDFHYNGHRLLTKYPDCAKALDKYRINPGNVGQGIKHDEQFETIIKVATFYNKPVRIGVNWGSLDPELTASLMNKNKQLAQPKTNDQIINEALIISVLSSAEQAQNFGLAADKIILSCKVSKVQELVKLYKQLAKSSNYALHLGLTEAGIGSKAIVASTAALAILLNQQIGNTIRISLTPSPTEARSKEVEIAQEILQALDLRSFKPAITSCPGCGRTSSDYFRQLAVEIQEYINQQQVIWLSKYHEVEKMTIAIMGCIVNGPGESKHADIGISLPGSGEYPAAVIFAKGIKIATLKGENIANDFKNIIEQYITSNYQLKID